MATFKFDFAIWSLYRHLIPFPDKMWLAPNSNKYPTDATFTWETQPFWELKIGFVLNEQSCQNTDEVHQPVQFFFLKMSIFLFILMTNLAFGRSLTFLKRVSCLQFPELQTYWMKGFFPNDEHPTTFYGCSNFISNKSQLCVGFAGDHIPLSS